MVDQFSFVQSADGDFLLTAEGDYIAIAHPGFDVLLNFLAAMRTIAIEEGLLPSTKPDQFDTNRGKRLHKQFWVSGRLISSSSISQAADNTWEITYHLAWQPSLGRSDVDFGFYELFDQIASLNNAWQSKMCPTWDEPISVSSATPEWDDELKAWNVTINVQTQERRSWAPTS